MVRPATAAIVLAALALGACSSTRFGPPVRVASVAPVAPVTDVEPVEAVPTEPVMASELPPLAGTAPGGSLGPGTEVAALPPASQPVAPAGRSAVIGSWSAKDASGASCRLQLSSAPALDLYRASASGCSGDLAGVNAWDYRDGELYLYQRGGAVTARLRPEIGGLGGVLTKSGAPVTLAR